MAIRFIIEINDEGQVSLEGPLGNKLLCYGILQAGMDAVRVFKPGPSIALAHSIPGPGPVFAGPNGGRAA